MKRGKLFFFGILFVISVVSALKINLSICAAENELTITNVEALAQGEGGGSGCGGSGTVVCNGEAIYYGKYY